MPDDQKKQIRIKRRKGGGERKGIEWFYKMSRCHKTIFFGTLVEDGWFARDAHIILQYIPVTVTHMPAGMGHPSMLYQLQSRHFCGLKKPSRFRWHD